MEAVTAIRDTVPLQNGAIRRVHAVLRDVSRPAALCSTCKTQQSCLSVALEPEAVWQRDQLVAARVRLHKGDTLYRIGDRFTGLYAIRTGSCKTVVLAEDGHDQVAGYHMPGEIIGTDGIGTDSHGCQAIALEDTEFCVMPFERIEHFARNNSEFQRSVHRLLSREISRERGVMLMLGTMRADQKLAAFLLDLSRRYQVRGYSPSEFVLRMTREEIGSYLGLKLETVSRLFSRLQREGLIQVQGRVVRLLDLPAIEQLVDCSA